MDGDSDPCKADAVIVREGRNRIRRIDPYQRMAVTTNTVMSGFRHVPPHCSPYCMCRTASSCKGWLKGAVAELDAAWARAVCAAYPFELSVCTA